MSNPRPPSTTPPRSSSPTPATLARQARQADQAIDNLKFMIGIHPSKVAEQTVKDAKDSVQYLYNVAHHIVVADMGLLNLDAAWGRDIGSRLKGALEDVCEDVKSLRRILDNRDRHNYREKGEVQIEAEDDANRALRDMYEDAKELLDDMQLPLPRRTEIRQPPNEKMEANIGRRVIR